MLALHYALPFSHGAGDAQLSVLTGSRRHGLYAAAPGASRPPFSFEYAEGQGRKRLGPHSGRRGHIRLTAIRCNPMGSGPSGFDRKATFPSSSRSEEHTSELQSLMRISYA